MFLQLTEADGTGNHLLVNADHIVWIYKTNVAGSNIVTVPRGDDFRPTLHVAETMEQISTLLAAAHV